MKVFLGWSGNTSQKVALALRDWLPKVIQSIKPYVSSEDIAKGARWATEIAKELQTSSYGIVCITHENSDSPWINFEAGALSREIDKSYVSPFLFNLRSAEIKGPLALFQSVMNEEEEILKLLESINGRQEGGQQLDKGLLKEAFQMWWPTLNGELARIAREEGPKPARRRRDPTEMMEQLLEWTQIQQRQADLRFEAILRRQEALGRESTEQDAEVMGIVTALARSVEALHSHIDPYRNLSIYGKGLTNLGLAAGLSGEPQSPASTAESQPNKADVTKPENSGQPNLASQSAHGHVIPPRRKK